ncbi:peptidyl-prolyl cis-trans isomerase FKBP62-like isoform A [Chlorella sorokiniana]|uniref:peptidylprolyl isomerase n=1 Tax=Chlorella sorokiniana TaxID=3076 RepID=A0A2P6TH61_CHLSO|nr:peptidyl-prolyl cis-trans isomerase FKBP62-like isoform A [Chlorella sorokiniana]|eukprot:PRW33606.1 peptidyl-prolyl cis-trans isomerase FKBP62-like isoform A [Chlorella sorokiniana]
MATPMDGLFTKASELMKDRSMMDDEAIEDAYSQPDAPGKVVQITEDGGVVKEIVKPGTGWEEPESGDKVRVHYTGTLEDGTKFDSSRDRNEPFEFPLGLGQVIKGWDLGVATMKKGEISKLTIKSDYGYGASGSPPTIPGGATLIFEVELLDWTSVKDIAGDGGVIKTIVKEGSGWGKPLPKDEVRVRFAARVQGAEQPFYATADEGEEFTLDQTHFCRAIATAAGTMKKGEEARLVVKPEYGFGAEGRGAEVPPNATLEIDITLLGWNKVEKVTDDGLVVKKTLEDTEEWKKPNAGSQCTIAYTARLPNGTVFDARSEEEPLTFTTDEGQVIDGLDQAVMKMKEGEHALVTIPAKYAFGDQDSQQPQAVVPAGSTVEYDVKLLRFVKAKDTWEMDPPEKVAAAAALKDKGNAAFKAGNYRRAIQQYDKALQAIEFDEGFDADQKKAAKEVKKSCNLNLAAAQLKLGNAAEARKATDKVLEVDSSNAKALYRRAQAWMATGDFVEAELDIRAGLAQEPESTDFKLLLKRWKAVAAAAAKKEAGLYSGMMKALGGGSSKKVAGEAAPAAPAAAAENAAANGEAAAAADSGAAMES